MQRKWRGELDIPLTAEGLGQAYALSAKLEEQGSLSMVMHDWLSRDRDTARALCHNVMETRGPRPWKMGPCFEGHPITRLSINFAQFLVEHPHARPYGGEPFFDWYTSWMSWLNDKADDADEIKLGIVTHNRNIQAVYATVNGELVPHMYDCDGPNFCTIHYYKNGKLMPWRGNRLVNGLYLIRHGQTNYGT